MLGCASSNPNGGLTKEPDGEKRISGTDFASDYITAGRPFTEALA
jgi:hypothetical protein